ncbi:MAG: hypothetical protein PHP31_05665 [Lentimicrobiaceae bacterium]|nr:hypothetical protein [Lentimicrobiaceae bacterium]
MLIIVSKNISKSAHDVLSKYGTVIPFETQGIVYPAISDHPDIFFCNTPQGLVVSPNTPQNYIDILEDKGVNFLFGNKILKNTYPNTAHYNVIITSQAVLHNFNITDNVILNIAERQGLKKIHVNQGYARCTTVALNNNMWITSDDGIYKTLLNHGYKALIVNPDCIKLSSFPNGFFGGICGIYNNLLFVNGKLNFFSNYKKIINFINDSGMEVVELVNFQPIDIGTIIFI